MKQVLLTLCFFLPVLLSAQFGVTGAYSINQLTESGGGELPADFGFSVDNGYEAQLHYWFRLPKRRIEFQPTLYFSSADANGFVPVNRFREIGFQFETNVYIFDLAEDCDCPTFGKQGPQIQKGFFLQLSPGIASRGLTYPDGETDQSITFVYGAGLGLDIGITNLLTVTPIATFRTGQGPFGDRVITTEDGSTFETDTGLTAFQLGVQVAFRLDYKRY